uniref:Integrase catalytic domain-containing protein n=1 Tax=Xenopus tropicalis TaxID=8364 RepID=A0A803J9B6_XENTR
MPRRRNKKHILQRQYFNPRAPGSYGGIENLYREVKKHRLKRKDVKEWLNQQDVYALHKPVRKNFKRNKVVVSDIDSQWQADLVSMIDLSKENDGIKYILTVIDVLSKYAWCCGLRNKTGTAVATAFQRIFEEDHRTPIKIQTDRGKEFLNKEVKQLFDKYKIRHFVSSDTVKCSLVERFNRTLKTKMWRYLTKRNTFRYIDILPNLVYSYNHTYHSSIRCRPADVTKQNSLKIWKNLYYEYFSSKKIKPKFKIGDDVRISKYKGTFSKGYEQSYTDEIFTIYDINTRGLRPLYKLKDLADDPIDGSFYAEEIQKVPPDQNRIYRIEKIIKRKNIDGINLFFVKWMGYPPKFNCWIEENQLTDL